MARATWLAIAVCLAVCALLPQSSPAVEGMGSHRGSVVFFPYWTIEKPFLTVWRITNATDLNDPTLLPIVAEPEGKETNLYTQNPVQLHIFLMEAPDCMEADQYFPFTPNDYRLIVVNRLRGVQGSGWAYGYATLRRGDRPVQVLVWDRFFSDTVVVNTADGWARGWHNWQQWARVDALNAGILGGPGGPIPTAQVVVDNRPAGGNGLCDYSRDLTADFNPSNPGVSPGTNDVCVFGPDNVGFSLAWMSNWPAVALGPPGGLGHPFPARFGTPTGWYWALTVPSSFYSSYFTELFRYGGARANPTEFSITPVVVTEPIPNIFGPFPVPNQGETAAFSNDRIPDFAYDAIIYDPDENAFSVPAGLVICQEVLDIHALTDDGTRGLVQGYVHFWALDPPGDPNPDFSVAPPDWDGAAVLSWDRFPNGRSDLAWGYWTTHDKTTVDDRDIHFTPLAPFQEDLDPEAP